MMNFGCRDVSAVKYSVVVVTVIKPGADVWCAGNAECGSVMIVLQFKLS